MRIKKRKKTLADLEVNVKKRNFATAFGVIAGRKKCSLAMLRWAITNLIIYTK